MRVLHAAQLSRCWAAPAYAQQKSIPKYGEAPVEKTRKQIEEDREAERAYKRFVGNIPTRPDRPLGNARSVDAPRPCKPSPAKPKTKTSAPQIRA